MERKGSGKNRNLGGYRTRPEYNDPAYRAMLARLKRVPTRCRYCKTARATGVDHVPPLHYRPAGKWRGKLVPACRRCNLARANQNRKGAKPTGKRQVIGKGGKPGGGRTWGTAEQWRRHAAGGGKPKR